MLPLLSSSVFGQLHRESVHPNPDRLPTLLHYRKLFVSVSDQVYSSLGSICMQSFVLL